MLDELPLGVRYSAVGHEFSVTESTVDIKQSIFKQKHTQNKVMYWLVDENIVGRD